MDMSSMGTGLFCRTETCKKTLKIRRLPHCFSLPQYDTLDSTGLDLYAAISDLILLQPNEKQSIPTGIAIELPKGYEGQIRSKGSMVTSNVTIDSNSRKDEIKVVLVNTGENTLEILPGAVIAQIVIMKYIRITWDEDCSGRVFSRKKTSLCSAKETKNEHSLADEPTGTGASALLGKVQTGTVGSVFGRLSAREVQSSAREEPTSTVRDENLQRLCISLANFDSLGDNGYRADGYRKADINEAKNVLQELLVKHKLPLPKYEYDFIGPSNNRTFKGTVTIKYSPTDTMIVTGDEEYTKKDAEKSAALNALKKLKGV